MSNMPVSLALDLTTTQKIVLEANPWRRYALIINDSNTICYLGLGIEAILSKGIRLNANGGSFEINLENAFTGRIYAISTGTTKRLTIIEISYGA